MHEGENSCAYCAAARGPGGGHVAAAARAGRRRQHRVPEGESFCAPVSLRHVSDSILLHAAVYLHVCMLMFNILNAYKSLPPLFFMQENILRRALYMHISKEVRAGGKEDAR
jgi:hypothetical protein